MDKHIISWIEWTVNILCKAGVPTLVTYCSFLLCLLLSKFYLLIQWLSFCFSQRKSREDDLLSAAGQERALPQLWGWGFATAQWCRSVFRGQEGSTQGRELLFSASVSVKELYNSQCRVSHTGTHYLCQWICNYLITFWIKYFCTDSLRISNCDLHY